MGKISKVIVICISVVSCFALIGCATIFKEKTAGISFTSEPEGATVSIDNIPMGKTPIRLELIDKEPARVLFHKDGYEDKGHIIPTYVPLKWALGSIFPVGWIGVIVDACTGNWRALKEKEVHIKLDSIETTTKNK